MFLNFELFKSLILWKQGLNRGIYFFMVGFWICAIFDMLMDLAPARFALVALNILLIELFGYTMVRTHSADIFEKFLQKQQLGGKRKIPVTMGVHQASAFLRSRKSQGLCVGLIFLDLCEASLLYRIVRELAIGGPVSDEVIAAIGHRLCMGPDLLHKLYKHLDTASGIAQAGMNPQMQTMVQALHADTHFHVAGQADRCKTTLGTRPGDCWADFVFSFLWARLLEEIEDELHGLDMLDFIPVEHGLRFGALPDEGTHLRYLGPTWMDDSCFCLSASRHWNERPLTFVFYFCIGAPPICHDAQLGTMQDCSLADVSRQRSTDAKKSILGLMHFEDCQFSLRAIPNLCLWWRLTHIWVHFCTIEVTCDMKLVAGIASLRVLSSSIAKSCTKIDNFLFNDAVNSSAL